MFKYLHVIVCTWFLNYQFYNKQNYQLPVTYLLHVAIANDLYIQLYDVPGRVYLTYLPLYIYLNNQPLFMITGTLIN